MPRFVVATVVLLVANAVGLLVAAVVLADMQISFGSFVIAVAIFTAVSAVVRPVIMKMAEKHADSLMGGTALIATLVGLVATSIISDGFIIRGAGTWLLATIIVWLTAVLAGLIIPAVFIKRRVDDGRDRRI